MGKRLNRTLLAGLLLCIPLISHAAGLGRLTVHSGLGQPLRAEIEIVSLERGEVESLTAKLAGQEAFRQANIDLTPALQNLRFTIEQRPNNRHVVLMSSSGPVNEPFLDVLVELSWATGRLIRENTFLLDPQEFKSAAPQQIVPPQTPARAAPAAPAVPEPRAAVEAPRAAIEPPAAPAPAAEAPVAAIPEPAPVPEPTRAAIEPPAPSAPAPSEPTPTVAEPNVSAESIASAAEALRAITEARRSEIEAQEKASEPPANTSEGTPASPPQAAPAARPAAADGYKVVPGDTLSKIAVANMPEGVTLNQMLAALYRANQDAFVERNMNRLRSGRILNIPDRDSAAGISRQDANNVVVAHIQDWNAYRGQLAAAAGQAPARPETAGQSSGGQISARVTDAPQAGATPDRLQLAQADPAAKADSAAGRVAKQDDSIARDRALQESQARVTQLEKSLKDIEKLLELKAQELARLQSQAKGADAAAKAPTPTPPKVEAPKIEAPKVEAPRVEAPKVAAPTLETPKVEPPRIEAPVAEAPKVEATAPPVARPPVAAAPKPAPAPAVETSIVDDAMEFVTDNLMIVGGAAGGLVLIGLLLALRRRRANKVEDDLTHDSVADSSSVFGSAASSNQDTQSPSVQSEFSQGGIGAIDTEEVDPVAEADVYMAYGRDAQAEEILKEALQKDQSRHAVRVKLMEIYAARKDLRAFETTAGELYAATGGEGPDWEKAAALGTQLDPSNTMYQIQAGMNQAGLNHAGLNQAGLNQAGSNETGFDNGRFDNAGSVNVPEPTARASESYALPPELDLEATGSPNVPAGLDIALDSPSQFAPRADLNLGEPASQNKSSDLEFDLNLGDTATKALQPNPSASAPKKSDFDIEFDLPVTPKKFDLSSNTSGDDKMPEFDMDLELSGMNSTTQSSSNKIEFDLGSPKTTAPCMDLEGINLDLGDAPASTSTASQLDPHWQEVATKLDLAKAYHEMGDRDGAKELLGEVMKEGDGAQQQQARKIMDTIA